jgi:hypothetical protein
MKMGTEPKKLAILGGLVAVAAIVYWMNSSSDAPAPTPVRHAATAPDAAAVTPAFASKLRARRQVQGLGEGLGVFEPEAPVTVDASKVDPTIRLDLLAKVQAIELEGGNRNIFKVEAPPPEPAAVANAGKIPVVPGIHPGDGQPKPPVTPTSTAPTSPTPAGAAGAPPINLKYYGYSTKRSDGERKAFFLDGEDIIVASEGDIIKKQYKVVRITNSSVQMEDTTSKTTQTLPLTPEAAPA